MPPTSRTPAGDPGLGKGLTDESTGELIANVDDLLLLAEVVEAGGMRAASERTGLTKSRLSRRIAALEERLKVCLFGRSSRRFEVTEIGQKLYEQSLQIRAATRAALNLAEDSATEPGGVLRIACPMALSQSVVCPLAVAFSRANPRVRLCLTTTIGAQDALREHYDLIIHPTSRQLPDSGMVARLLRTQPFLLVASPELTSGRDELHGPAAFLDGLGAVGWNSSEPTATWRLFGPDGAEAEVRLPVRFAADNLAAVRDAALAGLGVARLPTTTCEQDIRDGNLRILAPGWAPSPMSIYVLYPSRRRLSLAGQRFVGALQRALEALPSVTPAPGSTD